MKKIEEKTDRQTKEHRKQMGRDTRMDRVIQMDSDTQGMTNEQGHRIRQTVQWREIDGRTENNDWTDRQLDRDNGTEKVN